MGQYNNRLNNIQRFKRQNTDLTFPFSIPFHNQHSHIVIPVRSSIKNLKKKRHKTETTKKKSNFQRVYLRKLLLLLLLKLLKKITKQIIFKGSSFQESRWEHLSSFNRVELDIKTYLKKKPYFNDKLNLEWKQKKPYVTANANWIWILNESKKKNSFKKPSFEVKGSISQPQILRYSSCS